MSTTNTTNTPQINLDSGTLVFGNAKTDAVHTFDLMILQLTIEEVEGRHRLKVDEKGYPKATPEFLTDLATAIDSLGFDGCSPTQAFHIWNASAVAISALKKNIKQSLNSVTGFTATPADSPPVNASDTKPISDELKPNPESTTA